MEDEDLLDLDTFAELLEADDFDKPKEVVEENEDGDHNLKKELNAMRERVKLLEEQLKKKSETPNTSKSTEHPKPEQKFGLITEPSTTSKCVSVPNNSSINLKERKLELMKEDIFMQCNEKKTESECGVNSSLVHHGDTDSSDDEEKRNNKPSSLNDFGRTVKKRLQQTQIPQRYNSKGPEKNNWKLGPIAAPSQNHVKQSTLENVETDPFSGLRIINPVVSSVVLRQRMADRKMIRLSLLSNHIRYGDIEGDWVTIGVIINKTEPKTSKNGKTFSIWKLNDLQDLESTVSLFLFGEVHKGLWKTSVGSVIGMLNSKIMPNREGDKVAGVCLTVDHPGKIMLIGQSKDFGTCKGKKRNGGNCTNLVNKKDCEFCVYHVQTEYKKAGRRMDLQSSFSGVVPKGFKNPSIKAKILSKSGVMYGGQLYTVPLGKPEKPVKKQKDKLTLSNLNLKQKAQEMEQETRKVVAVKHLTEKENQAVNSVLSNSEFLGNRLTLPSAGSRNFIKHLVKEDTEIRVKTGIIKSVTPKELLEMHKKDLENRKRKRDDLESSPTPTRQTKLHHFLKKPQSSFDLELTDGTSSGTLNISKMRAIVKLSQKPVKKEDPNAVRKKQKLSPEQSEKLLKRIECNTPSPASSKLSENTACTQENKLTSRLGEMSQKDIERIMKMKSSHSFEVDQEEASRVNLYFKQLEKKEQLEKKMQTITEITCTVVSCKICNYTSQHPSELCTKENHLLRRHKAQKRFFRCVQCKHRTFCFSKLPTKACRNCGSSSFERTAMMKPKEGPKLDSESLLIRGEEIKFIK